MAFQIPNGSVFEIAASYASAVPVTAVSNAAPAVATAAANGLANGDVVSVSSGWTNLDNQAVRVSSAATDSFDLEGVDTTSVQAYPAGSGVGSIRKVASWAEIAQITDNSASGGDQQFVTVSFLASKSGIQLPTEKNPASLTLTVADDPSLPFVAVAEAADTDLQPRVVRLTLPSGSIILYNAFVSITQTPTLSRNNVMTRVITLSLASKPTRYASESTT